MATQQEPADAGPPGRIEPLSDPTHDGTHVTTGVISNGCTTANNFRIDHAIRDGVCLVTVVRHREDNCRRMPHVVQVLIPMQLSGDCAELPVEFTNPGLEAGPSLPGRRSPDR